MKKKIIAVMLSCSLLSGVCGISAFADKITGVTDGYGISVNADGRQYIIINGYDENGILKCSVPIEAANGNFILASDFMQYAKLRAGFIGDSNFYDIEIKDGSPTPDTPQPTAEPTAAPTASPSASDKPAVKPEPTKRPLKSGYEREVDAMYTYAIVREVSTVANADDEECYRVKILYQGYEMAVDIKKSIAITSSSDAFSFMDGQDAGALEEGDVIYFTATLSGEINSLSFIMRAVTPDILTDGNDYGESFEKLFSNNGKVAGNDWGILKYGESDKGGKYQFAFGVISKKSDRSITLLGPDGNTENKIFVGFNPDVPVYVCEVSDDNKVSLGNTASLTRSGLPTKDEIISYENRTKINYAFVRLVNGTASDIVIYKNK